MTNKCSACRATAGSEHTEEAFADVCPQGRTMADILSKIHRLCVTSNLHGKAPQRGFTCPGCAAFGAPQPRPEAASRGAPGSTVPSTPPRARRSAGAATAPGALAASGSPRPCSAGAGGEGRLSVQLPSWGFLPVPGGTLVVKTLFLISSLNLPYFSAKPAALVPLQQVPLKTLSPSFLLAPFKC